MQTIKNTTSVLPHPWYGNHLYLHPLLS